MMFGRTIATAAVVAGLAFGTANGQGRNQIGGNTFEKDSLNASFFEAKREFVWVKKTISAQTIEGGVEVAKNKLEKLRRQSGVSGKLSIDSSLCAIAKKSMEKQDTSESIKHVLEEQNDECIGVGYPFSVDEKSLMREIELLIVALWNSPEHKNILSRPGDLEIGVYPLCSQELSRTKTGMGGEVFSNRIAISIVLEMDKTRGLQSNK